MSYEVYKVIHFLFIFLAISGFSAALIGNYQKKWIKIVGGISSLMILVSGMGLLARIGIGHGDGFPVWVWGKVTFWLLLSILGPVFSKKLTNNRVIGFFVLLLIAFSAAIFAVFKF